MRKALAQSFTWITEMNLCPCNIAVNMVYGWAEWIFNRLPRRYSLFVSGIGTLCCIFLSDHLYPDKEN